MPYGFSLLLILATLERSRSCRAPRPAPGAPPAGVARERARVAVEGWGARLLDLQGAEGHWGGAAFVPRAWISTMDTLQLLRDLGADPASDRVRTAIGLVRERCTWGKEFGD